MNSKIICAFECFVQKEGKYLILNRNNDKKLMPGISMAPGGKKDDKEGLLEAVRREIFEETDLFIKNIILKAIGMIFLQDIQTELCIYLFKADYKNGRLKKRCNEGVLEWKTKAKIKKTANLLSELIPLIDHITSKKSEIIFYKAVYSQNNNLISFEIEEKND